MEDITNPEMILIVGVLGLVVNVIGLGLFASESPPVIDGFGPLHPGAVQSAVVC